MKLLHIIYDAIQIGEMQNWFRFLYGLLRGWLFDTTLSFIGRNKAIHVKRFLFKLIELEIGQNYSFELTLFCIFYL